MVAPYKIIHIDIDSIKYTPPSEEHGYYFVFWKNDVPIADWYVEKGFNYEEITFRKIISEKTAAGLLRNETGDLAKYLDRSLQIDRSADISIVICTRNRTADLKICIDHLNNQTCTSSEIIVVDNAPSDNSTEELVKKYDNVKYVKEQRLGLDIARNTGAMAAKSPIIAYIDDDVRPHPLWIYHIKESFTDENVMALTGLVIAAELETESQQIFEKYWSFNRGYTDKYYDTRFITENAKNGPPVWEIGAGANMAFRKSVFTKVGYFDERLDVGAAGCNGDSEMWFRILELGGVIHYNPRAVSFHKHRKEIKQLKKQIFYYMRGFAAAAMIQQNRNKNVSYSRHLFRKLPIFYLKKSIRHFPFYSSRYRTIFNEAGGLFSGFIYYILNKKPKS